MEFTRQDLHTLSALVRKRQYQMSDAQEARVAAGNHEHDEAYADVQAELAAILAKLQAELVTAR